MQNHYILAGNYREARDYASKRKWRTQDCFYIQSASTYPHAVHDITVICVGTWTQLPDLDSIERILDLCNPIFVEDIGNGLLSALQRPISRFSTYKTTHQGGQQTKMPIKCRIWWDQSLDAYTISSSYSSKLVDSLKQFIPAGSRDFDQQTKFWHVKEQYGEFVKQVAEASFGVGSVSFTSKNVTQQAGSQQAWSGRATTQPITSGTITTDDAVMQFFSLLTYEAAKKAYLVASSSLHPDKPSGDGQKMSRLNELWQRLEKEFFKR